MEKSKVYFTKDISASSLIKMFDVLGKSLMVRLELRYLLEKKETIII